MVGSSTAVMPRGQFRVPVATGLPLDRVLTTLTRGDAQLTLITAPAGSGKTTMLAHIAQDPANQPVAWWHAGSTDTSAAALIRALGGAVTLALDGSPVGIDSSDALLTILERAPHPLTIVIDDAHALVNTEAEHCLGRLIDLLPAHVRLLMGARYELGAATNRARLGGRVVDVGVDQLRFRSWEVEALFRDCYRQPLPPEDAAALTHRTDGWIAALQMFHLATSGKPLVERQRAVASLLGRSRLLRTYLTSTVLATLSPDVADFLVLSSALVVLDGPTCDDLLDRRDSQAVLESLANRNLFTIRCEDGWHYRYHGVLQSQLESMLSERLGAADTRGWYQRAGAVLEGADQWAEAYRAYARAEDWTAANRLVRRGGADLPVLADDPWITLARARGCRAAGRLTSATNGYTRAEEQFDDPRMKRVCRYERRQILAWTVQSPERPVTDEWTEWLRYAVAGRPDQLLVTSIHKGDPEWRLARGIAALLAGRVHDALPMLRDLGGEHADFVHLAARLAHRVATAVLGREREFDLDEIQSLTTADGVPWLARMARAARALIDPAHRVEATTARLECDAEDDHWGVLLASMAEFVAIQNTGAPVESVLSTVVEYADRLGAPVLRDWAQLLATRGLSDLPTTHVVVRCLGELRITVNGEDRDWPSLRPRAQAVLGLLLTRLGQAVHEGVLMEALWPELLEDQSRRNLQVAVSAVRRLVEPDILIERRGDTYRLAVPADADVDVRAFAAAIGARPARESLRSGLQIYGGELLPEFGAAEWVVRQRDRLALAAADAATTLAELELDADNPTAAGEACRRALDIDSSHDRAWRLLITAHAQAGNVAAGQRARREYARVLTDLGVPDLSPEELDFGDGSGHRRAGLDALDNAYA